MASAQSTSKQVQQARIVGVTILIGTHPEAGRYTDDGDDRVFRQVTDDEQGRGARPDRSESGFG